MVLSLGWGSAPLSLTMALGQGDAARPGLHASDDGPRGPIMLAIASFGRSYYIGWVGERVVTDLRHTGF
jgi:hypothetical protein